MMVSLMSIFDPSPCQVSLFNIIDVYWIIIFWIFFFPNTNFWKFKSSFFYFLKKMIFFLFNSLTSSSFSMIAISVFFFILFFNLLGLLPLSFCLTSHFFFHFVIGSVIWFGPIFFLTSMSTEKMLAHFTPAGSPLLLSFMLVPIEIVSLLIRPFALSLRLMANMIAGHMILALLQEGVLSLFFLPSWSLCFFITAFEVGVSFIQSYVFSSLLYLYWKENSLE